MPSGASTLGRFEAWAEVLGGILSVAGVPGFLGGRERLRAEADRETREWAAVCAAWWQAYRDHPVTARDVFAICKERRLLLDVWGGRSELSAQQRLGHALASRRDRVFDGYTIRSAGRDGQTGSAAYSLERRDQKTPETPETLEQRSDSVGTTGDSGAGLFRVFTREEPKPRQNPEVEKSRSDAAFDASAGVSGVSVVSLRGHSQAAGDAVPGGEERQRPDGKTPETPETPDLPAACQYRYICAKVGACDELWCTRADGTG